MTGYEKVSVDTPDIIRALNRCFDQVTLVILESAQSKGYSRGPDGDGRALLDFIGQHFPTHVMGEVVYKAIRWENRRNPEDLLKIIAWAFLEWDRHYRTQPEPEPKSTQAVPTSTSSSTIMRVGGRSGLGGLNG